MRRLRGPVAGRAALAVAAMALAFAFVAFRSPAAPAPAPAAAAAAPPAPVPAVPPAAAARPSGAPAAVASVEPAATEDDLMARLRADVDASPQAAIALAEDGERRFPSGKHADERAWLRMRALVHVGEIAIARDAARQFFERHPQSPLGRLVFRLTGMRPLPPLGPPR